MEESRQLKIERLAGDGNIDELKKILGFDYTQLELDVALENAIAYSQIKTAEYLMQLGADISNYNYQGVYYAVHNDELDGLNFAISKGVDVNFDNGILLNTSIIKAINTKNIEIIKLLLYYRINRIHDFFQVGRIVHEIFFCLWCKDGYFHFVLALSCSKGNL
jgi:ankyrin repeat protein